MTETIQSAVGEPEIDYNALDNTFAGQLVQAGFIYAILAARSTRTRVGLGVANLATIAVCNAFDEDPRNDLTARVEAAQGEEESVALSRAVLAGLSAGAIVLGGAASRGVSAAAGWLGKRGVTRPNSLLGLAGAAAYVAAKRARA